MSEVQERYYVMAAERGTYDVVDRSPSHKYPVVMLQCLTLDQADGVAAAMNGNFHIPTGNEVDDMMRAIVRAVQNDDMHASAKACNSVRRVFEVQRGEVPLIPRPRCTCDQLCDCATGNF